MAKRCSSTHYWDPLVHLCQPCNLTCKMEHGIEKCKKFCVVFQCHELKGHYYDGLLRKCAPCTEVCKGQDSACPRQCLKAPVGLTAHSGLDSSILLYSLWALTTVLLFSSLSLALKVFLREAKPKPAKTVLNKDLGPLLEEVQSGSGPADNATPTENCVCVHCYPDLRGLALGLDYPIRESHSNLELERQRIQDGRAVWTHGDIYTSRSNAEHKGPVQSEIIFNTS